MPAAGIEWAMEVMNMEKNGPLRQEILLMVNERLYSQGVIPKSLYELARLKISERKP